MESKGKSGVRGHKRGKQITRGVLKILLAQKSECLVEVPGHGYFLSSAVQPGLRNTVLAQTFLENHNKEFAF